MNLDASDMTSGWDSWTARGPCHNASRARHALGPPAERVTGNLLNLSAVRRRHPHASVIGFPCFHFLHHPVDENLGDLFIVLVQHHHVVVPLDANVRQMKAGAAASQAL